MRHAGWSSVGSSSASSDSSRIAGSSRCNASVTPGFPFSRLLEVRRLSAGDPLGQVGHLVGKPFVIEAHVHPRVVVHGEVEGSTPSSSSRPRRRSTARRCRILAAPRPISRTAAISSNAS